MSAPATCWEYAYRVQTERLEELRRENAALRKAKEMVELERCEMMRSMSLAQNRSKQLRADKDRLDWLARNRSVSATERPLGVTPESLRAAIDAARKEAQP